MLNSGRTEQSNCRGGVWPLQKPGPRLSRALGLRQRQDKVLAEAAVLDQGCLTVYRLGTEGFLSFNWS